MQKRHIAFMAAACCALCEQATAQADLAILGSREQLLAAYEGLPRAHLERLFLLCDAESSQHALEFEDGVMCGMAWDTLLRHGFGGDIASLLAWWREHRDPRPAVEAASQP